MPHKAYWRPWFIWGLGASFFFLMYVIRVSPSVIHIELMQEFKADATALGLLVAFFYYSYLAMQIPAGMLIDRYGPRTLLSLATAGCGLSAYLLAHSFSIEEAYAARILLGIVSAFAFVGTIKLATTYFPPRQIGLIVGITQGLGMLGASFGQGPMAHLNEAFGWRTVYIGLAWAFMLLACLILFFVKPNKNNIAKKEEKESSEEKEEEKIKFIHYLKKVLFCRLTWINALYAGFIYAPVEVFGEFWGVAYLESVHHINRQLAANASSLIFIGWFIGGPLAGWLSNYWGRKSIMSLSALCGLILTPLILYWPGLSSISLSVLLFLLGLSNGGLIASYTVASELHPKHSTGLCMGITNMVSVIIGSAMHPIIGALLDRQAHLNSAGLPSYDPSDYRQAMILVPLCSFVALILSLSLKETLKSRKHT